MTQIEKEAARWRHFVDNCEFNIINSRIKMGVAEITFVVDSRIDADWLIRHIDEDIGDET